MQNLLVLLEAKKFIQVRRLVQEMNEVDLAELISEVNNEKDAVLLFRLLPKGMAAEVFSYLEHDQQQRVVEGLTDKELAGILEDLFMDDTVDFIDEMPASIVKRVIKIADPDTRRQINQLLMYPDSSAGSLMTIEFMEIDRDWDVARAIREIRRQCEDKESLSQLFVTDEFRHLEGTVALRGMLAASDSQTVSELIEHDVKSVNTHDDQANVAEIFKKYDLVTMPVVDNENRLVGLITIDDVVDVMEEETTEDIYKMAAMAPTEVSYANAGVLEIARKRIGWLMILMISGTFTGMIMKSYNTILAAEILLSSFIPMLMDTSGNAGSQTSVSVIRSLVLGELQCRDIFRVLWKELRVGLMVGVGMGLFNFIRVAILYQNIGLAAVVGITLFCTVVAANLLGGALPILATRLKLDPALMASPMITTLVDAMSLTVFFNIAMHLLPGLK